MKRTQFLVAGTHPLFPIVIECLVRCGYALVTSIDQLNNDAPVFLVFGAEVYDQAAAFSVISALKTYTAQAYPVLVLSSSSVYSDRDFALDIQKPYPMDEAQGHVLTSTLDSSIIRPMTALMAEYSFLQRRNGRTLVVRPFNVYGPGVSSGVISEFVKAANSESEFTIHGSGRQTRTFLWQEDFTAAIEALVSRLCKGHRGIYNIGNEEQVEILSVAKSVGHAWNIVPSMKFTEPTRTVTWKLPAIDRIRVDANWRPRMSLRSGLFLMASKSIT